MIWNIDIFGNLEIPQNFRNFRCIHPAERWKQRLTEGYSTPILTQLALMLCMKNLLLCLCLDMPLAYSNRFFARRNKLFLWYSSAAITPKSLSCDKGQDKNSRSTQDGKYIPTISLVNDILFWYRNQSDPDSKTQNFRITSRKKARQPPGVRNLHHRMANSSHPKSSPPWNPWISSRHPGTPSMWCTKMLTPLLKAVKVIAMLMISKTGNFNLCDKQVELPEDSQCLLKNMWHGNEMICLILKIGCPQTSFYMYICIHIQYAYFVGLKTVSSNHLANFPSHTVSERRRLVEADPTKPPEIHRPLKNAKGCGGSEIMHPW